MSIVHRLLVSWRRILARRPWLYWLVVVAIAMLTIATVVARASAADRARAAWKNEETVWIAERAITPGDDLATALKPIMVPEQLVPPDAIDQPIGTARQYVDVGAIVTAADIGDGDGPLALVPQDHLVVSIIESTASGAMVGESVVIASEGTIIADTATVVGHADTALQIAVPEPFAAVVALAAETGRISILRAP